jgi:Cytochrome P450
MLLLSVFFLLGIIASGYLVTRKRDVSIDRKTLDFPGPYLLPWIGRVHDLPITFMWVKFKEWADIYGPIYKTRMLGATFLVVSDEQIAEELLVKRAKIYSDRPAIRSLFDSKSTHGSMEYLPLMGKNSRETNTKIYSLLYFLTHLRCRILGTATKINPCLSHSSIQQPLLWGHWVRN